MAHDLATTVLIAGPGGVGARPLGASSVAAMWSCLGESTASVSLPTRDLLAFGRDEWLGAWVRWDHPSAGIWGGIVTDVSTGLMDGTSELTATSMHWLLRTRRTPATYRQAAAPGGALAIRAIQDADSDRAPWIATMAADLDGPVLSVEWHGEPVADVIGFVASEAASEWDLEMGTDWRVAFTFRPQLGRDKTGAILLIEGREFGEGTIRRSLEGVTNDVLAVANEDTWRKARKRVAVDGVSVSRYGRLQSTLPLTGVANGQTILQYARAELDRRADAAIPLSIELPARSRHASLIRHGDTVGLWAPSVDRRYRFRVVTRAVDSDSGMTTLSGDAEETA